MIFSESEIEEIQDTLCDINISPDDKFGIMIMHVHGNLSAHFRGFCDEGIYASQGICSNLKQTMTHELLNISLKHLVRDILNSYQMTLKIKY